MRFLLLFIMTLFTAEAMAYVVPTFRDIKPATQMMIEKQSIAAPLLGTATRLKSANASSNSATTTITTFTAQPDVPRNIVITTGGTTASCSAGSVVVSGTNFYGNAITESFTITSTQNGATTGAKAFKAVSSVLIPIQGNGSGCTYSVGTGSKLGLKSCMATADHYSHSGFGGVKEVTAATIAANASAVESNTASLSSALDGASNVNLFYMQNFACHP